MVSCCSSHSGWTAGCLLVPLFSYCHACFSSVSQKNWISGEVEVARLEEGRKILHLCEDTECCYANQRQLYVKYLLPHAC